MFSKKHQKCGFKCFLYQDSKIINQYFKNEDMLVNSVNNDLRNILQIMQILRNKFIFKKSILEFFSLKRTNSKYFDMTKLKRNINSVR